MNLVDNMGCRRGLGGRGRGVILVFFIALLLKVPIVVFKYDRSFDHYTIVDVAIYGSGGFNQHIVCLLHTDDNKFDWLELWRGIQI